MRFHAKVSRYEKKRAFTQKFAIFRAIRYKNCAIFRNVPCYEANYLYNAIRYRNVLFSKNFYFSRKSYILRKYSLFAKF